VPGDEETARSLGGNPHRKDATGCRVEPLDRYLAARAPAAYAPA
jgi:hypothetical protein